MASLTPLQCQRLAERIEMLGRQRGLHGPTAISAATGGSVTTRTLTEIPNGSKGPTLSTLLALCRGLRVYSIDQLLGFSSSAYLSRVDEIETALAGTTAILQAEIAEPPIGEV